MLKNTFKFLYKYVDKLKNLLYHINIEKRKRKAKMRDNIKSQVLNCKKVETAINRAEKHLIEEAKKNGLYENLGQDYARAILDKFLYSKGDDYQSQMQVKSLIQAFSNRMANLSIQMISNKY